RRQRVELQPVGMLCRPALCDREAREIRHDDACLAPEGLPSQLMTLTASGKRPQRAVHQNVIQRRFMRRNRPSSIDTGANRSPCMPPLSRRRTISLASSFAALSLLRRRADAQAAPGAVTLEMASFLAPGADADAAFAKAIAAIEKAAGEAAK